MKFTSFFAAAAAGLQLASALDLDVTSDGNLEAVMSTMT